MFNSHCGFNLIDGLVCTSLIELVWTRNCYYAIIKKNILSRVLRLFVFGKRKEKQFKFEVKYKPQQILTVNKFIFTLI